MISCVVIPLLQLAQLTADLGTPLQPVLPGGQFSSQKAQKRPKKMVGQENFMAKFF